MRAVESQWWIIELPDEWEATQDEDTIVITDEDDVGEIVITTLEKQTGVVTDQELREFTRDLDADSIPGAAITLAGLKGYYYSYNEADDAIREWYLRSDSLLLLITYCCDCSNAAMDDSAVDDILSTVFIKPKTK